MLLWGNTKETKKNPAQKKLFMVNYTVNGKQIPAQKNIFWGRIQRTAKQTPAQNNFWGELQRKYKAKLA